MGKRIEVFTADCSLCRDTLDIIRKESCGECEIIEQRCSGGECCEPVRDYVIKAVPTVVVDGKVSFTGKPSLEEVKKLFV